MKLAIFGALLGSGLFIGGFIRHDINYTGGPNFITVGSGPYEHRVPHGTGGIMAGDNENHAFLVATAGAAILTISLKQLWNHHKGKPEKPYGKFQLSRDLAAGFTLWMVGVNTHDWGTFENDGLVSWRNPNGQWGPYIDRRYQMPERLGFAGGMLGTIWMSAATKQYWDTRKRD